MHWARAALLSSLLVRVAAASPWGDVADPVFLRIDQKALPHPAVYAVAQDASGFIWVGTPGGLARYDGHRFRHFPPAVQALLADPSGTLWIGTPSNGLLALDTATDRFRAFKPRSATVIALARNPDGRLWVGGDRGLDLLDPASDAFQHVDIDARVEAILVDRAQGVWVATVRGLFHRPRSGAAFRLVRDGTFFSLYEDSAGRLWAGSVNAVFAGARAIPIVGEQWGIIEVTPGVFWVATYDGGISIVDDASRRVRRLAVDRANPGGFTPGDVWQFFRDRSGLIWVANGPGGLLVHNPLNRGIHELFALDKDVGAGGMGARAIAAASDGALWLGGAGKVVRVDPRTGMPATFTVPGHVQALHGGADGTLWIGTVQGLCRLRQGAVDCPYRDIGRVFAILERDGTLWVGSGAGVAALDERSGAVTRYGHGQLSNDFVTVLYADRAGRIWAGTSNGLNRIDPQTHSVTRFLAGSITSIVEDRRGRVWAGAFGGPLCVLDGGRVRRLDRQNIAGLALGADGQIWASATNALLRIDPDTFRARVFGPAEGVQETEFWTRAVATAPDGTIFFAGTYAVTVIAPGASAEWTYAPPLAITALRAGGRDVPRGASIELPAGDRDIAVEFAALDYSAPEALRYAYTLDGYNHGWIDADAAHRLAAYTNLSPGNYTLRVRATNRLGAWSTSVIALQLRALPAWYETWWFRALVAALLVATVLAVIRARTRILRQRARRLEAIVAERTSELATANAALENMSVTDALTGLRNRRFLMQRIDDDVALALRQGTDLVFFHVDIDHFKAVNDQLGHAAGDAVLRQMRERLEQVFRASDYVLRWGGEEFLAITRGSSRDDAAEIAERLRLAIAERPFLLDDGQALPKTASIGFAAFPMGTRTWEEVVELADQALYRAKNSGRNTWVGAPTHSSLRVQS
ncbi:MAG TPA: diguanylate cyclase [Thermoanaerobaculia bacterium]|jgi:diguanylate cyclase (GGDEF)-like protein